MGFIRLLYVLWLEEGDYAGIAGNLAIAVTKFVAAGFTGCVNIMLAESGSSPYTLVRDFLE
jgi:hypothetical protein